MGLDSRWLRLTENSLSGDTNTDHNGSEGGEGVLQYGGSGRSGKHERERWSLKSKKSINVREEYLE